MAFTSGCNHPSFTLPWRTLLPYLVALHLLQLGSAQITVVAPSLRVTANVGQDVVLRCHLSPCKDAWSSDIRWIQHRSSGIVHHYQDGVDLEQMTEYKGRTELLRDGLSDGNLDLRISAVSSSDSGSYSCVVQDGDGYAEAVVDLEVSDPFSQIVRPWKVALAVVTTLLVGSCVVINVFLYRKKERKDAELERKDAELVGQATIARLHAAELKKLAAKLDSSASDLKEQAGKLVGITELEKQNSQINKYGECMDSHAADLKKLAAKLDLSAADLKEQVAKLMKQTEKLEKDNSGFKEEVEQMDLSAADLTKKLGAESEKQAAESEEQTEELEMQKSLLRRPSEKTVEQTEMEERCAEKYSSGADLKKQAAESDLSAADLTEKHVVEMAEETEAVEQPSKEQD